jgi:hypothetical protein
MKKVKDYIGQHVEAIPEVGREDADRLLAHRALVRVPGRLVVVRGGDGVKVKVKHPPRGHLIPEFFCTSTRRVRSS